MTETESLLKHIIEGIQNKKGKRITLVDMTKLDALCSWFVICEGSSSTQIMAICDSIEEHVRKNAHEKPMGIAGYNQSQWVAMDYSDIMVHIFDSETRQLYQLEQLWSDAKLTDIPDLV